MCMCDSVVILKSLCHLHSIMWCIYCGWTKCDIAESLAVKCTAVPDQETATNSTKTRKNMGSNTWKEHYKTQKGDKSL